MRTRHQYWGNKRVQGRQADAGRQMHACMHAWDECVEMVKSVGPQYRTGSPGVERRSQPDKGPRLLAGAAVRSR